MSDSVISIKTETKDLNSLTPEGIKKCLECPICNDLLDVPMKLCETGHMICGECRVSLPKCPLCEAEFTDTRNFLGEDLLRRLYKHCSNKNGGCDFKTFEQEALEVHEKFCDFRPFVCNISGPRHICKNTKVRFNNMAAHMKDGHRLQGFEGTSATGSWESTKEALLKHFNGDEQRYDSFYLECHGKMFLACQILVRSKAFLYAVLVGNSKDAKRFRVVIKIENSLTGIETTWKGPVTSMRRQVQQLIVEAKGLTLTTEAFFSLTSPITTGSSILEPKSKDLSWKALYQIEEINDVDNLSLTIL